MEIPRATRHPFEPRKLSNTTRTSCPPSRGRIGKRLINVQKRFTKRNHCSEVVIKGVKVKSWRMMVARTKRRKPKRGPMKITMNSFQGLNFGPSGIVSPPKATSSMRGFCPNTFDVRAWPNSCTRTEMRMISIQMRVPSRLNELIKPMRAAVMKNPGLILTGMIALIVPLSLPTSFFPYQRARRRHEHRHFLMPASSLSLSLFHRK